ncbi:MAG TPA: ATP-binding cassette domain-containing protein [Planctomycetota bacterium]|nr:ATP-binding cassette domain-containing protein [Planctomycetota bacterium]
MDDAVLTMERVRIAYGTSVVADGIDLAVRPGEFVALVGPSGCGKSSLLNLWSRRLAPAAGQVGVVGRARTVHQQNGLLPWLTIGGNVAFGLRHVVDAAARRAQIEALLELVGLPGSAHLYPAQLSGGMRQRVELARALAGSAEILLLDEPFSALDYLARLTLRGELLRILARRPRTVVLVTHDIEEAVALADRVIALGGRPSRVLLDLPCDGPRPRPPGRPATARLVERVLVALGVACDPKTPAQDGT